MSGDIRLHDVLELVAVIMHDPMSGAGIAEYLSPGAIQRAKDAAEQREREARWAAQATRLMALAHKSARNSEETTDGAQ